ncbi:MAG TPA: alpha/beta fold hydrolase [Pyrinomonadaceae bacterium]|nr:alpha/beta fold hydrolase [Pyrinomonadaceae bacterium]
MRKLARLFKPSLPAALVLLFALPALAQTGGASATQKDDGRVVEQAKYELPAFDELPERFRRRHTREQVETMRAAGLELSKIKYLSDGLKINGFVFKPKHAAGQKLPAVIFNRGGAEDGLISAANFNYLYEMHRLAEAGFVVLASQYRGADGSEGRDELGGADTKDVINLIETARSLGYVDMGRVFMWGYSRGGLMTLQAVAAGAPLRAAVVVGPPTDWELSLRQNPGLLQLVRARWPDFDARRDYYMNLRSPARWADKLTVPLLIFQGGADPAVSPQQALLLAQRMEEAGNLYELVVYARDDHPISVNAEDRIRKTIDWFKNVRVPSVVQPLRSVLREQGVEAAVRRYHELKKTAADRYDFAEAELNNFGYELLFTGRVKEAVEIFKLNVAAYPEAFNTYDSLGEAYLADGQRDLAVKNYKRSLELNPQNTNAVDVLKRIGEQVKQ